MFVGALVPVVTSPLFGAEDPLQPVSRAAWYHGWVTYEAALGLGWAPGAAAELAWHAVGVDLYAYHPLWRLAGGPARWRGARWARNALTGLHFDNLPTTADIEETWLRILGGTRVALTWAAQRDDVGAARSAIGAGLHAIQDFYSHSTWIDDPQRRGLTWLQSRGLPEAADLSTGGFGRGHPGPLAHGRVALTARALPRLPALVRAPHPGDGGPGDTSPPRCPPPSAGVAPGPPPGVRHAGRGGINLDSRWQAQVGAATRGLTDLDGDAAFEIALALAARETRAWLAELEAEAADGPHAGGWERVRAGAGADWTAAFDSPAALAYQFLTAGRALPAGRGDACRWFLRIDVADGGRARTAVHVLAADGRLLAVARPPGHAIVAGPLPDGAAAVRLQRTGDRRAVRVHAFRRAPQAELRLVLDDVGGTADAGSGRRGVPLDLGGRGNG